MKKIEKTFTSETRSGLKVNFSSENIGITITGSEAEESVLKMKLEYSSKSEKEFEISEFLKMEYDNSKNEMNLEIDQPDEIHVIKVSLALQVPVNTQINAVTENGPVAIAGLTGKQVVKTENGPAKLGSITGDIDVTSENGPIVISKLTGDIIIKTENGPVKINGSSGNCQINGENGLIKIKEGSGELKIRNENGQVRIVKGMFSKVEASNENGVIYYDFQPIDEGNFSFTNQNGKISLILPDEVQCDLNLENEIGRINIGIEGNYDKRKENGKNFLHLLRESGRVKISASNENGSINVSSDGSVGKSCCDFSDFTGMFDEIMHSVPEGDVEKVKIKLERAKEKLEKLDLNKLENKINKAAAKIEAAFSSEFDNDKNGNIMKKVKVKISDAMENLNSRNKQEKDNAGNKSSNEQSKLMILKMLQEGKITSDEAEKLLKAIGE